MTEPNAAPTAQNPQTAARIAKWRQKLLDFSMRNRLLNAKDGAAVIPLFAQNIADLEDRLAANASVTVHSVEEYLNIENLDLDDPETRTALQNKLSDIPRAQAVLCAALSLKDLKNRLLKIYRQARNDLDEGGVNTLFLALGFLEWKPEGAKKPITAPIILVPLKISRGTQKDGITIAKSDEETVINVTLLEFLRQQCHLAINGLTPPPLDDSGVDVDLILNIVKDAVQPEGWNVLHTAKIGLFSFNKITMWNDMNARSDDLCRNPIVQHLITPNGDFDDHIDVFPPDQLAANLNLEQLFCPVSADASQLTAVLYSRLGKSFVLYGPPGTGKSQTITNIIAHNLACGRRVLFVSAKKAALDVVHKRLSSIGLKPFCLELHSNKSGKADVLAQFREALDTQNNAVPQDWQRTIAQLNSQREELDGYVKALHTPYPNGLTPYQCFSRLITAPAGIPNGLLAIDTLTQSHEDYDATRNSIRTLVTAFTAMPPEQQQALRMVRHTEWTPALQRDFTSDLEALHQAANRAAQANADFARLCNLPAACADNITLLPALTTLADTLKHSQPIPPSFLTPNFPPHADRLTAFLDNAKRLLALRQTLQAYDLDQLSRLNLEAIETRFKANNARVFFIRYFANRSLLKEIAAIKKPGAGPLTADELTRILPSCKSYTETSRAIQDDTPVVSQLLGDLWNDSLNFSPDLTAAIHNASIIHQTCHTLCADQSADIAAALNQIAARLANAPLINTPDIIACQDAAQAFLAARDTASRHLDDLARTTSLNTLAQDLGAALEHASSLRLACIWNNERQNAAKLNAGALAEAVRNNTIAPNNALTFFDCAYANDLLDRVVAADPRFSAFSGASHEQKITRFRELSDVYTRLTRETVIARLSQSLDQVRQQKPTEKSELGILRHEIEKKMRHKPVRQLLELTPTIAPLLKPCFLMSPLSVAQYLPPDSVPFDLIVFDEASQIPVWDAIGVIARGKQLIVVGDPKQMPPTSFFQKTDSADDTPDEDDITDEESILDECIAAGIKPTKLKWHYRSRHESLITFSNRHYYDNDLFTFPAASNAPELGVSFVFVPNGIYDAKKSRTNANEAQTLVDHLFTLIADPANAKRSIGVVTFSQAQKDLLDDLVEAARSKHPELEAFFAEDGDEPFFVKNLENVQGDERDIIMFSVGYAPDESGKFAMNFGPLNRAGGERRLNVAITRAKEKVIVFSSIHAGQIDPERTSALGALHLREFIAYAEKGPEALNNANTDANAADGIVEAAEQCLANHGFQTRRNIGNSRFRIPLAVVDPHNPDRYLLALECDGPTYAAQNTTRDRDQLRESVLRNLGWQVFRLWSVDWLYDRANAEKALLATVQKLVG